MYGGAAEADAGTTASPGQPSSLLPCRARSLRALRGVSACHFKCWGSRSSPDLHPLPKDAICSAHQHRAYSPPQWEPVLALGGCLPSKRLCMCCRFSCSPGGWMSRLCLSLPAGISATLSFTPPSTRLPRLTNMSLMLPFTSPLILAHNAQCVTSAVD